VHAQRRTLLGEEMIAFREVLLRCIRSPLVMAQDRYPIHRCREVKDFLTQHTRLHIYDFPTSASELNAVEWIWKRVDDFTASTAAATTMNCGRMSWQVLLVSDIHHGANRLASPEPS
jgi:hypothetical protein